TGAVLLALALLGFVLFFRLQVRSPHPVFQVSLLVENRVFAFSCLAALLNYSATFGTTFLMSLYLQYIQGLPPQTAGLVLMAQPVMMALFSPAAGRLSDRVEPRLLASAGMGVTVAGMLVFTGLGAETPLGWIGANLVLLGLGFALFSSPNMSAIMGSVAKHQYGLASGTAATMRLLGQMTSMATATVVLALLVGRPLDDEAEVERAALELVSSGRTTVVVVSLGAAGALLATGTTCERLRSPTVPIRSKVGAGDSMVAGIVAGLVRGLDLREAVRFGVAAGAAAVMTPGSELCRRDDTERLYRYVRREVE
ncbi:MAG: MFS transporter, partial [Chloroflexia bacterium]|nr:MFS transporter [Chloroflexia bacterium]